MSGELGPDTHQNYNLSAREYAEQSLARYKAALAEAISIAYPEEVGQDPETVFPERTEPRNVAPSPGWDADTTAMMRSILEEFGVGRSTDENISALGLPGSVVAIVEAGQPQKIKAELELLEQDEAAALTQIIFTGSPKREVKNADERVSAEHQLGKMPDTYTEYYVAGQMAMSMKGFEALPQPEILERSYVASRERGFATGTDVSGQFVKIGTVRGADVILMRLDREDYTDGEGRPQYRNQPEFGDVMQIVSASIAADGTSIAYVTSNTYKMSRDAAALQNCLTTGRPTGVATYGTAHLATVKGETAPGRTPANQIPGELHVAAEAVRKLHDIVYLDAAN